jgi:ribosome-binding protein aMBF1 (putative translation factor)
VTPTRLIECMALLRWTNVDLAAELKCSEGLVRQMAKGKIKVREDVAHWLETLVKFHVMFQPPVWEKRDTKRKREE